METGLRKDCLQASGSDSRQFHEGVPAFQGSGIHTKSHIQVAVRDPACILGYFKPTSASLSCKLNRILKSTRVSVRKEHYKVATAPIMLPPVRPRAIPCADEFLPFGADS